MPTEEEILRSLRPDITTATLNAVTRKAHEARDLELEAEDLERRLKDTKQALRSIYHEELPTLMDQAQTDRIGVPAEGNMPAYDLRLSPFYRAVIPANWSPEQRANAFQALTDLGHADLIKTEVTIMLPRERREDYHKLTDALAALNLTPDIKETVHWKTLTAWLQEQFEHGNPLPPLEAIGAEVGRVVKMTERKNG
jgi:hypothetical protein